MNRRKQYEKRNSGNGNDSLSDTGCCVCLSKKVYVVIGDGWYDVVMTGKMIQDEIIIDNFIMWTDLW